MSSATFCSYRSPVVKNRKSEKVDNLSKSVRIGYVNPKKLSPTFSQFSPTVSACGKTCGECGKLSLLNRYFPDFPQRLPEGGGNFCQFFAPLVRGCSRVTETEVPSGFFFRFQRNCSHFFASCPFSPDCVPASPEKICEKLPKFQKVSFPAEWKYWYQPFFTNRRSVCREK